MNNQRPEYLVPALIGGSIAGFLSGIPFLNCLCCLWILGGAILAVSLLAKNTSASLTAGDGAIVGALSGIAAAVVNSFIGIPMRSVNARIFQQMTERLTEFTDEVPFGLEPLLDPGTMGFSLPMFLFGIFLSAAVFAAVGALGGIVGVSLFGRKKTLESGETSDAPQDPGDRQSGI